ncbi:MAG: transporter substrate-binding domain-containing protein [Bacillota bacterium]|nr:transporter substrate-binding domain-containing protein [Bacillota bacterium]
MKKITALVLAMLMVFALCACGGNNDSADNNDVDYSTWTLDELKAELKTVTDGKLTVATSPDFAPYEFYAIDENGDPSLAGFDMALAQLIADKLGLELEVIPMDFDGTISELGAGKCDISLAGYSPDPKREDLMNFSEIYYKGGQSFWCTKASADKFSDLASANNADYTIGAQTGSIQADLAAENCPDANVLNMAKVTDIIADMLAGKMDGAFIETLVGESYAKNYPDLQKVCDVPYDQEGSVVGVNKDNAILLAAINIIINEAVEDGTIAGFVAEANELAAGNIYEGLLEDKD